MKASKVFLKPFKAPQRSVKIKIQVSFLCSSEIWTGRVKIPIREHFDPRLPWIDVPDVKEWEDVIRLYYKRSLPLLEKYKKHQDVFTKIYGTVCMISPEFMAQFVWYLPNLWHSLYDISRIRFIIFLFTVAILALTKLLYIWHLYQKF